MKHKNCIGRRSPRTLLAGVVSILMMAVSHAQVPYSITQPPGPVLGTTATLNGMAVPRGNSTTAWFDWGPDANYGASTSATNIGSGTRVVRVSIVVGGLATGATYHYRLISSNAFGVTVGADNRFTTGTKVSTWSSSSRPRPSIPPGLTNIVHVASGHGHGLALRNDGRVVAWGAGIPGFYADLGQTNVPAGLTNVIAIAGGWHHSLALKGDGRVVAWGYNAAGQATVPATLSNVIAIAGADSHSLALKSDGTLQEWGSSAIPVGLTNVVAIAAGSDHNMALKADGTVTSWGGLSNPTTAPSGLSNVVAISTETWHNLALRADGTVVAWGRNTYGQTNVPAGLSNVVAIAAGAEHSLALKADDTLVAWGNSAYVTNVPVGLSNAIAITSGDYHSVAISPVNLSPIAFQNPVVVGQTNSDLSVSLTRFSWDANGDLLNFRLTLLPTNGALYQYTGTERGAPIVSPGTPLTDATWVIFAPQVDAYGAPYDAFGFVASDGEIDSGPGMITVRILPPPAVQVPGQNAVTPQGFRLNFSGLSNASYGVQASTNLINWSRIGSASQSAPGQFFFIDPDATNRVYRFYRVISP